MVNGQKPQTLLETLNVTNQDLYLNIYVFFTVLITKLVSLASSERSSSAEKMATRTLETRLNNVINSFEDYTSQWT